MASQNNLNAVFTDIANAIRDKKGTTNTMKPINMADEILTIETKSFIYSLLEAKGTNWSNAFYVYDSYPNLFYYMTELNESDLPPSNNVTNMQNMFYNCQKLTTIPQLDTSSCTYMYQMFYNCYKLTSIPQLNTSKVTNMGYMFYACQYMTIIPQLNTSKVTNMGYMFYSCYKLTSIPQLDTSKVTNMGYMFYSCYKLTSIPQLNTSKVTNMVYMFYECRVLEKIDITTLSNSNSAFAKYCYSIKTLIIRTMNSIPELSSNAFQDCYHFYGTTDSTYNPNGLKDGRIYVPDDKVESLKTATNWSVFADIIKPLSEYVE